MKILENQTVTVVRMVNMLCRKEVDIYVQTTRWQGTRLRSGSMRGLGRRENIVPPVAKDGDSM